MCCKFLILQFILTLKKSKFFLGKLIYIFRMIPKINCDYLLNQNYPVDLLNGYPIYFRRGSNRISNIISINFNLQRFKHTGNFTFNSDIRRIRSQKNIGTVDTFTVFSQQ
jgi:hypothetical protein